MFPACLNFDLIHSHLHGDVKDGCLAVVLATHEGIYRPSEGLSSQVVPWARAILLRYPGFESYGMFYFGAVLFQCIVVSVEAHATL